MTRHLTLIACLLWATAGLSNNVTITNVVWTAGDNKITFDISWENSWRGPGANPAFHDAVWVFVKVAPNGGPTWEHTTMDILDEGTLSVVTPPDLLGALVRRQTQGVGTASGTLEFELGGTFGLFPDFKVFGIEMVYVPGGAYELGDGASDNTFQKGDDPSAPYVVDDSDIITFGNGANDLFTSSTIVTADLPASFPNGFNAFYSMKYEISQSQYAEFLNCLTRTQQNTRTATDISTNSFTNTFVMTNSTTVSDRNSIRCIPPSNGDPLYFFCDLDGDGIANEAADGQNLAMNHMSYDDLKAYLDWAAMRPMSVLEYEKACRGPVSAVPGEHAWGTAGYTVSGNIINSGQATETFDNIGATGVYGDPPGKLARCGFAATLTSDRLSSGASYYGIMELSGNVREACSAGNIDMETIYGDGYLTATGENDVFANRFSGRGTATALGPIPVSQLSNVAGTVGTARISDSGGRGVR